MIEHDARELAVAAVGLGATDFYHKPLVAPYCRSSCGARCVSAKLEEENWRLRERTGSMALEGIIGVSDAMRSVCRAIEKVAPTNATVLLLGDQRHRQGSAGACAAPPVGPCAQAFAAINCAAIPDTLLESELFGYEKGAFTGAAKRTAGKLESADGGTVFLDEIGEMPASLQAKLLRVGRSAPSSASAAVCRWCSTCGIVCATNRKTRHADRHRRLSRRPVLPHQ